MIPPEYCAGCPLQPRKERCPWRNRMVCPWLAGEMEGWQPRSGGEPWLGVLLAKILRRVRVTVHAAEPAEWNRTLEQRVAEQVGQRLARLRRFLAPQIADLILAAGSEALLESHRREVVVLFCDLRGFTAFAEQAAPDEVMQVLHDYHEAVGALIHQHEGTLEHFLGDGVMVLFNDPVPCADPELRAVRLALDIRGRVSALAAGWRERGFTLGCGIGIARGDATLGLIGFEGRSDYTAVGSVANLASRLCAEADDRQILISAAVEGAVRAAHPTSSLDTVTLKGFATPVPVFAVLGAGSQEQTRCCGIEVPTSRL